MFLEITWNNIEIKNKGSSNRRCYSLPLVQNNFLKILIESWQLDSSSLIICLVVLYHINMICQKKPNWLDRRS